MECTEKILCFIAAGKWILTHSYLKHSLQRRMFLDEEEFHVSKRFKNSKLANISLKWKNHMIEKKQNAPFFNWNIGCLLHNEDKSRALARIVKAGYGTAAVINVNPRKAPRNKFTIIIYDSSTKDHAKELASLYQVPYYPFQAIPDYIMQCIISDKPVLPMSYYEVLDIGTDQKTIKSAPSQEMITNENSKKAVPQKESDADEILEIKIVSASSVEIAQELEIIEVSGIKNAQLPSHIDEGFLASSSYRTLAQCSNLTNDEVPLNIMNQEVDHQFSVLWKNSAFNEAFHLIVDTNEMPTKNTLVFLLKFLIERQNKNFTDNKYSFYDDSSNKNTYNTIYNSVFSYLLNLILNYAPTNENLVNLYCDAFKGIDPRKYILNSSSIVHVKGVIDVLYLISLHDYLLLNSKAAIAKKDCILTRLELEKEDVHLKLINLVLKDNTVNNKIRCRLLEILSFCSKYLSKTVVCKRMEGFISLDGKNTAQRTDQLSRLLVNINGG